MSGIDPRKLGLYRQDDTNESLWVYVGGVLDPDSASLIVSLSGFSRYAVMCYSPTFVDLAGHWSQRDVEVLAARYLVHGVDEKSFQPNRTITRAEFAKLLVEMMGRIPGRTLAGTPKNLTFDDVAPDAWYYDYVTRAAKQGLVQGSDGIFRPGDPMTREEMATMLLRAIGLEAEDGALAGENLSYDDRELIAPWARDYIALAVRQGLLLGTTPTSFGPKEKTTRAQAALQY